MPGGLFGSAPKASFSTQPTILPEQRDLLGQLMQLLSGGQQAPGVVPYTGSFAAPLNNLQNTSLAGLEAMAKPQATPQQTGAIDSSFNALTSALGYQAPQIDSTAAFQKGVIDPVTQDFTSKILPAISAQYAGSAGGTFSSGRQQASQQAGETLDRALTAEGSKFAYNAAAANQQAELTANQQRLAALGLAPGVVNEPTALNESFIQQLLQTLGGGAVPYNVAQTQLSGQYGEFGRQQTQSQTLLADMIAAALGTSQTTTGVGTGGSSGLLGGLLGSPALGAGVTALLSDERLKDDLEQVGEVGGFPLYKYRYKGEERLRLGLVAQDVEKRLPRAVVTTPSGYKAVDYATVLEHVFAEAA